MFFIIQNEKHDNKKRAASRSSPPSMRSGRNRPLYFIPNKIIHLFLAHISKNIPAQRNPPRLTGSFSSALRAVNASACRSGGRRKQSFLPADINPCIAILADISIRFCDPAAKQRHPPYEQSQSDINKNFFNKQSVKGKQNSGNSRCK